jgi:hypothetical protein
MLLACTSLVFNCPCPDELLRAKHRALTSLGKQRVPKERRADAWHIHIVKELTRRKAAKAAVKLAAKVPVLALAKAPAAAKAKAPAAAQAKAPVAVVL